MKDFSTIGRKLRQIREKRGLTLAQVAQAINKSISLVGSIERADRCPSLPSLAELAEYYQVPLASLFEEDLLHYQKQVGNLIQQLMNDKGFSVADLSNKAAISYFQLADFLQGRSQLSLEQVKTVATILDLSMKQVIPQTVYYVSHIQFYLQELGLDDQSIKNIIEYIYSKFE